MQNYGFQKSLFSCLQESNRFFIGGKTGLRQGTLLKQKRSDLQGKQGLESVQKRLFPVRNMLIFYMKTLFFLTFPKPIRFTRAGITA